MRTHYTASGSIVVLAIFILSGSCSDLTGPTTGQRSTANEKSKVDFWQATAQSRSIDDELADIAREVPGFGGVYFDASGNAVARLDMPAKVGVLEPVLLRFLSRHGRSNIRIRYAPSEFDFDQLTQWRALLTHATIPQLTLTDIDERTDKLHIGVATKEAVVTARQAARDAGIPSGALTIDVIPPTVVNRSITTIQRPMVGGLSIGTSTGSCTLGYIVVWSDWVTLIEDYQRRPRYLLTNSHCTDAFGASTSQRLGQPTTGQPIATEVSDPPLFSNSENSRCPSDRSCRWSDAALFAIDDTVSNAPGEIANVAYAQFDYTTTRLIGEWWSPFVGDSVQKVGAQSGMSAGRVTTSCVDLPQFQTRNGVLEDTGRTMLCQYQANIHSESGDSGGPIYGFYNGKHVALGILWGAQGLSSTSFSDFSWVWNEVPWPRGSYLISPCHPNYTNCRNQ
jgi:hypothetical protein